MTTDTPAEFGLGSKSPAHPSECLERAVRYNEHGDAVAVVFFTVWQHHLDFFVVETDGEIDPSTGRVLDTTSAPGRADAFAGGSLKWDGCMNFDVGTGVLENGCMAHACDPKMLRDMFSHVEWVYTLGPKIPAWDHQ